MATALVLMAACTSEFPAGSYDDGGPQDADALPADQAPANDGPQNTDGALPVDSGPPTCRPPSPDYGPTSVFPLLPNGTPTAPTTCSVACGTSAWPLYGNTIDIALPYGACAPDTPPCSTIAAIPCDCGSYGAVDWFNCSCEGGTWICGILSLAAVICTPCPDAGVGNPDGGNDAAPALQGVFVPTGSMTQARASYTATLLPNGKVLVAGGQIIGWYLASAELYDPAAGTFAATGSMTAGRGYHTATLLPNGKVLVAGGEAEDPAGAELYDPSAGTFTATGSMTNGRVQHTATLLTNGKVLVAGGLGNYVNWGNSASAELYDPSAGTFTATGWMTWTRQGHTATLLPSGKVLVAGGSFDSELSAELYDPAVGTFTATSSMVAAREMHTATLLPSGKVLIAGGSMYKANFAPAELYDPAAGTFTATGNMTLEREQMTATLLPSGVVLITGGGTVDGNLASAELYDPAAGTFTATGSMTVARDDHTATLLPSGTVLIVGGESDSGILASAELYE